MTLVSKLKMVLKKKQIASLLVFLSLIAYTSCAHAFTCRVVSTGEEVHQGSSSIFVNLAPMIGPEQNLLVDLSREIQCKNDSDPAKVDTDYIKLLAGSAFGGDFDKLTGSVYWAGFTYPMPLTSDTIDLVIEQPEYTPMPFKLYITPFGAAGGTVIDAGELIAVMRMYKIATFDGGYPKYFTWNIYANNSVIVPTGGCDVSSRSMTVTLPDYPGSAAVPLTVHCAKDQKLAYYLTGPTADTAGAIFTNTASSNPATGVGVQLSNANGIVVTNKNVSLGTVGPSPVSLGMTASYARTTGQVVAGNVQSIIGVTFVYE